MEASKTDDGSVSPSSESARFIAGLESGDLAALRRVPKADLHVHAYLGGCRAHVLARTGQDIPPLQGVLGSMDDMHAWNETYVGPVFKAPGRRALPFEATFVQCVRDGVARIDMGLDVTVVAREWATPADAWTWLKDIHRREAPAVDWLPQLGASRGSRPEKVEAWAEPLLELGTFRTFDLYGDELARPVEAFKGVYRSAKAAGLILKCHVGEWGTADDVVRAVEVLELDEVQHGIAAAESSAAMRFLADAGVRLNLCPTSNLKLGRVKRIEDHPIRRLYDAGVRVTVNSDDPLMFGSDLSEEFLLLFQAQVMSAVELDLIRRAALSD
jgi:adenosine deaminase